MTTNEIRAAFLRYFEGQGHRLISQGKDLACRCPWHEGDDTPSCIVSPKTNLWHCFGCNTGGSVIDWIMRSHKVSFRHACELLTNDESGWLVAARDPRALQLALAQAMAEPERRARLGAGARAAARDYAPELVVPRWEAAVERVLAGMRASG